MADQTGALRATPSDLVEIHDAAIKNKGAGSSILQRAGAYIEEGRLMILELIGYLTTYYRRYTFGISRDKMYDNNSGGDENA